MKRWRLLVIGQKHILNEEGEESLTGWSKVMFHCVLLVRVMFPVGDTELCKAIGPLTAQCKRPYTFCHSFVANKYE